MSSEEHQFERVAGDDSRTRRPLEAAGHILTDVDADHVEYRYRGLVIQKDAYGGGLWNVCDAADGEYLDSVNTRAVRTASELVEILDTIAGEEVEDRPTADANGGVEGVEG